MRLQTLNTLAGILLTVLAQADILELKKGEIVNGEFAGGTQSSIRFQVGEEMKVYPLAEILALTITGREVTAATATATPPANPGPASYSQPQS